jgi:hypothetical protein
MPYTPPARTAVDFVLTANTPSRTANFALTTDVVAETVYKGSAGWGTFYKGIRNDAQVYRGTRTLR